jgi:oligopeptide transport system substrate-binding protein
MTPNRFHLTIFFLFFASTAMAETIRRGLGPEPDSLHIHQAQGLSSINVLRDIREGLMTYDSGGSLVPGGAESWTVEDNGHVYRFRLRSDARWSNGDPVTASDFVSAWRKAVSPSTSAATAALLDPVKNARAVLRGEIEASELGIEALAKDELLIRLERPAAWFIEILAHPVSYPLHPDDPEGVRDAAVNGAFRIREVQPQALIGLERNPYFHAASSIGIDGIDYLPIEDPSAELARFRADELEITETIPPGRYQWLMENLGDNLHVSPYLGSFWLGFNLGRPPFGEARSLRRALALAIDRQILTRVVLGAGEIPAGSLVPPGLAGYEPELFKQFGFAPEDRLREARRLYREAGYNEARPLRVELRYNTSSQHRRMAVAVAAMWKQALGVHTQLVNEEWKVFVNNRRQGVVTQVFRAGWIADFADPVSFLDLFRGDSELNATFYANPQYDGLLARAAASSGKARMRLLQQAELLLMQDMPAIPLYYYVSRHLVKSRVTGFSDNVRDIHLSRYLDTGTPSP